MVIADRERDFNPIAAAPNDLLPHDLASLKA